MRRTPDETSRACAHAVIRYARRLREIDLLTDMAQLAGRMDYALVAAAFIVDRARQAELTDPEPGA